MSKLSEITKPENKFYTVDGQSLVILQDLVNYLLICDEDLYAYHVNDTKNDFANWVREVLVHPDLSESMMKCKNVKECRNILLEFLKILDNNSSSISKEKNFYTYDGIRLRNLHELYYYINNSDEHAYNMHVNSEKNDFANWINDVLLFSKLAVQLREIKDREEFLHTLKQFLKDNLSYNVDNHKDVADSENRNVEATVEKDIEKKIESKKLFIEKPNIEESKLQEPVAESKVSVVKSDSVSISNPIEKVVKIQKVENAINLNTKLQPIPEEPEPENKDNQTIDISKFRQFTDEELEKFVNFSRHETVDTVNIKVEYLKSVLQELKNMIKDLRRSEKDPLVADLLARAIAPKIDYYALTKSVDDYNYIITSMKEIQHEIEECDVQKHYNIAEEILKDLKLQGIAMKKAL
jgi:hypothetical protein